MGDEKWSRDDVITYSLSSNTLCRECRAIAFKTIPEIVCCWYLFQCDQGPTPDPAMHMLRGIKEGES